jgi:hypothetical protein
VAARRWAFYLHRYHYLGLRVVGENLGYLVADTAGREVACLLFGAAAWRCAARDQALGWSEAQRRQGLSRLANNTRFLILPWVRVPHLASAVLGAAARRIGADWQAKYGHGLDALETFVERGRFAGTCYRAANWRCVGSTRGRSRQDCDRARGAGQGRVSLCVEPEAAMNALRALEQAVLAEGQEWTRRRLETQLQAQSDALPAHCPQSGLPLQDTRWRDLQLHIVVGVVRLRVRHGYAPALARWVCPAREAWGLAAYQRLSPELEARLTYTATGWAPMNGPPAWPPPGAVLPATAASTRTRSAWAGRPPNCSCPRPRRRPGSRSSVW